MMLVVERVRGADDSIKPGVQRSAASETPGPHQEQLAQPAERAIAESADELLVVLNRVHLEGHQYHPREGMDQRAAPSRPGGIRMGAIIIVSEARP